MIDPHALRTLIEQLPAQDIREWQDDDYVPVAWIRRSDVLAVLSALPETPWQAMETAPRDGTHIVMHDGKEAQVVCWFKPDDDPGYWESTWDGAEMSPQFWMPLPAPPPPSDPQND